MSGKHKIVIVDDHHIIIEGLEMLLSFEKNLEIVKTYTDGFALLQDLRSGKVQPELVLMDLAMPTINGVELSKIIKNEWQEIKIIVLSMNCDAKVIHELINNIGVEGYLNKSVHRKELVGGIFEILLGYVHLSEEAKCALNLFKEKLITYPEVKLSTREKEVVSLMVSGFTNREISEKLFISESTVETHRKNIYRKTETHSLPKLIHIVNDLDLLNV